MKGSSFAGRPWLAPALFVGRFTNALAWIVRHRPRDLVRFAVLLPLYLAGLSAWTWAFAAEGREGVAR
jgi:hypothetical protein